MIAWISISFLLNLHSILTTACEHGYTKNAFHGFQCGTALSKSVWQTAHPQCVWKCLGMRSCRYINHNSATGLCELGLGQCESLQPASAVMVNAFGPPRNACVHWGSSQEPGFVPVQVRPGVYVARAISGDAVVIGKLSSWSGRFWANLDGMQIGPLNVANSDIEILTKDDTCPLPWMPYTAGETLPGGVVNGGRHGDGSDTYVVKVMHSNGKAHSGYYHPASALAYYETNGVHTASSMDILVLL